MKFLTTKSFKAQSFTNSIKKVQLEIGLSGQKILRFIENLTIEWLLNRKNYIKSCITQKLLIMFINKLKEPYKKVENSSKNLVRCMSLRKAKRRIYQ